MSPIFGRRPITSLSSPEDRKNTGSAWSVSKGDDGRPLVNLADARSSFIRGGRLFPLTVAALCAVQGLSGNSSGGQAAAAETAKKFPAKIIVGATLPLTGPGGAYGKIMQIGLQMGLDDAAAQGIIGDSTFQLEVRDDQAQAGQAVTQTRDLVNSGAIAIVTAYTAPPLAQVPIAARAKVPVLNGGGNDPSLQGKDFLWSDVLMVDQEATAGMRYLHDTLGAKKVGILFETDYTPNALVGLRAAWKSISGSEPSSQSVDQTEATVGPQLEKLLAEKPDALYLAVDGNIATLAYKELAQRGVKLPLMSYSGGASVPEATNTPSLNLYYTTQSLTPTAQFEATAKKAGVDNITYLHKTFYNIGQTIAQALKMANSQGLGADGAGIEAVLQKSPAVSFPGCCGDVVYTANHAASAKATIYQVIQGKAVAKAELDVL
jgi:ABC-type branched-subunit amino acid transport system substrate-binding protein